MNPRHLYWSIRRGVEECGRAIGGLREASDLSSTQAARMVIGAWWRDRIPPRLFALSALDRVERARWHDYLFDYSGFLRRLQAASPAELARLAKDKIAFTDHCLRSDLPVAPILCVVGGDRSATTEIAFPSDGGHFAELIAAGESDGVGAGGELFAKPAGGMHGEGAFAIDRSGSAFRFLGRTGSAEDLFAYLRSTSGAQDGPQAGWIVQPRLHNDAEVGALGAGPGLSTLRVVTCMRNGEAQLVGALLKIVAAGNITDNFSAGSSGNLVAGIDPSTGELLAASASLARDWPRMVTCRVHPESGTQIAGMRLSCWPAVLALALRAQRSLPQFRSVGWDIAPTDRGVLLVEANGSYDVSIMQVAHRRGFRRELRAAIED